MGAFARAVPRAVDARAHLIRLIAGEYREMPGMRLTRPQFQRMWRLGADECDAIVRELVARDLLAEGADGRLGSRSELSRRR